MVTDADPLTQLISIKLRDLTTMYTLYMQVTRDYPPALYPTAHAEIYGGRGLLGRLIDWKSLQTSLITGK